MFFYLGNFFWPTGGIIWKMYLCYSKPKMCIFHTLFNKTDIIQVISSCIISNFNFSFYLVSVLPILMYGSSLNSLITKLDCLWIGQNYQINVCFFTLRLALSLTCFWQVMLCKNYIRLGNTNVIRPNFITSAEEFFFFWKAFMCHAHPVMWEKRIILTA